MAAQSDWYSMMVYASPVQNATSLPVQDNRPVKARVTKATLLIPDGAVFQGLIGSVRGTFKRNQQTIFQLDGTAIFQIGYGLYSSNIDFCYDYQQVHGHIVIDRNA